ncbi:helix-turn-helix domain-containing protein [Streptomyces misionensis]|uniref:helix-turn-helix domain-containing protein n=1 Tax=Streptomyces misionensis TaxID=67331 RepID=UPI0033F83B58
MTRSAADGAPQRPFADLAQHLIALRQAARLPQRVLAAAASVSRSAVQRAESGTAAPTLAVLDAYLRACGAGEGERARAHLLRTRGRTSQRNRLNELKAPAPDFITTKRDLALALAEVYERAGAPSLSDARIRELLPRTTAWRIVNRKGLPASAEQLVTFLNVCGISRPAAQRPYIEAYRHVIAQRGTRPAPPRVAHRAGRIRLASEGPTEQHVLTGPVAALARVISPGRLEEILVLAARKWAGREAHRNGTAVPDWLTATNLLGHGIDLSLDDVILTTGANNRADDLTARTTRRGADLIARTGDGGTAVYQVKSHRPAGPPPALPGVRASTPPLRPAPAACAP